MNSRLKNIVIGSPFEKVARRAYGLFQSGDKLAKLNASYNEQTFAVMERCLKSDSNCVDVGCHSGAILREILQVAPLGTHYAFEPLPRLYEGLLASFPGVNVYGLALSDKAGETSFQHVTSNPEYSGLKQRRYDRAHETVEEIHVKTELLDKIIPEAVHISFIKIDVEGAELQVFKGAVKTIHRCQPVIVFEHGLGAADCYGTTPEEVYDLLTGQCGLRISLMKDWLRGKGPLRRKDFATQFYQGKNFYFMAHPQK